MNRHRASGAIGTWLAVLLLGLSGEVRGERPPVEIVQAPLVGRPVEVPFSEAIARFVVGPDAVHRAPFQLQADVNATLTEALQPITLTLTVTALGKILQPPRRLDLRQVPVFQRAFFIEDVTDGHKEQPNSTTWRWVYRLRPRGTWASEVPGVPFVYYNPDIRPAPLAFQTLYSDPIALTVQPPELAGSPIEVPASVLALASADEVFAPPAWQGPGFWLLTGVLVGPPLGCLAWYAIWQRLCPDAARSRAWQRSQAARRALRRLRAVERLAGRSQAEQLAEVLVGYLSHRFEPTSAEPTPPEVESLLTRHQLPAEQIREGTTLIALCAAARFQPGEESPSQLPSRLRDWIHAVEEPA